MSDNVMKDLLGNVLEIGDSVVMTDYDRTGLYSGKVVKLGKNRAICEYKNSCDYKCTVSKSSRYVVKV